MPALILLGVVIAVLGLALIVANQKTIPKEPETKETAKTDKSK